MQENVMQWLPEPAPIYLWHISLPIGHKVIYDRTSDAKSILRNDQRKTSLYISNKQYVAIIKQEVFNKSEEKWRKVEESGK
jgi:hypothetical protein